MTEYEVNEYILAEICPQCDSKGYVLKNNIVFKCSQYTQDHEEDPICKNYHSIIEKYGTFEMSKLEKKIMKEQLERDIDEGCGD